MALLVTTDNRPIIVNAETAAFLWLVKTGERKATKEIKAKVKMIAKWHLNRATAPDSYLRQNPVIDSKKVRGSDKVINQGRLPYID